MPAPEMTYNVLKGRKTEIKPNQNQTFIRNAKTSVAERASLKFTWS